MTVNEEIIVLMFTALGAEADEKMGGDMRGGKQQKCLATLPQRYQSKM